MKKIDTSQIKNHPPEIQFRWMAQVLKNLRELAKPLCVIFSLKCDA
jgi:hypothetical protein